MARKSGECGTNDEINERLEFKVVVTEVCCSSSAGRVERNQLVTQLVARSWPARGSALGRNRRDPPPANLNHLVDSCVNPDHDIDTAINDAKIQPFSAQHQRLQVWNVSYITQHRQSRTIYTMYSHH